MEQEIHPLFSHETGAPRLPVRLVAGLLYLQHAYNVSDEAVVEYWLESPYWQHFCGETFFQHEFPCHPTSLTRCRPEYPQAAELACFAHYFGGGVAKFKYERLVECFSSCSGCYSEVAA